MRYIGYSLMVLGMAWKGSEGHSPSMSTRSALLIQKRMDAIKVSLSTEPGDVSIDGIVFLWMVKMSTQGKWIVWNFIRLTMWHRGVLHWGSYI